MSEPVTGGTRGARGARSRTMTTRLGVVVLASQVIVLFFAVIVVRSVTMVVDPHRVDTVVLAGVGLLALAVIAAATMRTRIGVALGWLTQAATLGYALAAPEMVLVGAIFTALWVVAMYQGRKMDALTDAYVASTGSTASA